MPPLFSKLILVLLIFSCCTDQKQAPSHQKVFETSEFEEYWYSGKAELNYYNLVQSGNGRSTKGNATLIFVTEHFSRKNQVKLSKDDGGLDHVSVLKLILTKSIGTVPYANSEMLSIFTPVNRDVDASSLKVAMSTQGWAGQLFTQMNLRGNRYNVKSYSYFEDQGDKSFSIKKVLLEDELWNMIRLDHDYLPIGQITILPGLFYTGSNHLPIAPVKAFAQKVSADSTFSYRIKFKEPDRVLEVIFEKNFPHKIIQWNESWSEGGKQLQTLGKLQKSVHINIGSKNQQTDFYLLDSLSQSFLH
jgi:hypothetical protein